MDGKRKKFSFFRGLKGACITASSTGTASVTVSDDEELPDLVLPPQQSKSGQGVPVSSDGLPPSHSQLVPPRKQFQERSKRKPKSKGLEIKQTLKRKATSTLETGGDKFRAVGNEGIENSPSVIDISGNDFQFMIQDTSVDDKDVVVIDLDGLDELSDITEQKCLSEVLTGRTPADSTGPDAATSHAAPRISLHDRDEEQGTKMTDACDDVIVLSDDDPVEKKQRPEKRDDFAAAGVQLQSDDMARGSTSKGTRNITKTEPAMITSEPELDHRRKKLYDQQRPIFKMVNQLKDIARNQQYLMRNPDGEVSLENDNVAQYIIDMGVLLRQSGQELKDVGKEMQKKISDARAAEQLQLKTELSDSEVFQESTPIPRPRQRRPQMFYLMRNKRPAVKRQQRPPKNAEEVLRRKNICQLCGFSYVNRDDLETHLNRHADHQIICDVCGKAFYSSQRFSRHEKAHSSGFLKCSICGMEKENKSELKSHVQRHDRERYVCTVEGCEKSYIDKGNWLQHVKTGHTNARPVQCQICGRWYKNKNVARAHRCRDHADLR